MVDWKSKYLKYKLKYEKLNKSKHKGGSNIQDRKLVASQMVEDIKQGFPLFDLFDKYIDIIGSDRINAIGSHYIDSGYDPIAAIYKGLGLSVPSTPAVQPAPAPAPAPAPTHEMSGLVRQQTLPITPTHEMSSPISPARFMPLVSSAPFMIPSTTAPSPAVADFITREKIEWKQNYNDMVSNINNYNERGDLNLCDVKYDSVKFNLITYNVEHHGFTANTEGRRKAYNSSIDAGDHNEGYREKFEAYNERLKNVLMLCESKNASLIGFNEIGVLGYNIIKEAMEEDYFVIQCIKYIDDATLTQIVDDEKELSFVDKDDKLEIMNIYSNICCIKKSEWTWVPELSTCLLFNNKFKRHRSNTLMINFLSKTRVNEGEPVYNIIWFHTHLYYQAGLERDNQRKVLVDYINYYRNRYSEYHIIVSGDLYIYDYYQYGINYLDFTDFLNDSGLTTTKPNLSTRAPNNTADRVCFDDKNIYDDYGCSHLKQYDLQVDIKNKKTHSDHYCLISYFELEKFTSNV